MSQEILITGGSGQLGSELRRLARLGEFELVAVDRHKLDLTDGDAIAATIASRPWAAVINAAAYTAVDAAEANVVTAWRVNALAPATLAQSCAAKGIPLVQVSTDYVFSGSVARAWEVEDPVAPLNVYGASKCGGELAVRTGCKRHAIVRTAWVGSAFGTNFLKTMLRLATERDTVRVVGEQFGSPTSARDLAQAVAALAVRLARDPSAPPGTFHFTNNGQTSWAEFASEIFRQSTERGGPRAQVEPISSVDYPTAARRPGYSILSSEQIRKAYGIEPRPWQDALGNILDELIGPKL